MADEPEKTGTGRHGCGHNDLTHEQQLYVCKLFAEFYRAPTIAKKVREKFGVSRHHSTIQSYATAKKWKPAIAKFRQQFLEDFERHPIANKVIRIRRLEALYQKQIKKAEEAEDAGMNRVALEHRQEARMILSTAKTEMEGDRVFFQGLLQSQETKEVRVVFEDRGVNQLPAEDVEVKVLDQTPRNGGGNGAGRT